MLSHQEGSTLMHTRTPTLVNRGPASPAVELHMKFPPPHVCVTLTCELWCDEKQRLTHPALEEIRTRVWALFPPNRLAEGKQNGLRPTDSKLSNGEPSSTDAGEKKKPKIAL